jgi:hypothetical protein
MTLLPAVPIPKETGGELTVTFGQRNMAEYADPYALPTEKNRINMYVAIKRERVPL